MNKGTADDSDGMTRQYFAMQTEMESQYGPNTIVIWRCGTFYELYETEPDDLGNTTGKVNEMRQILNLMVTRRNKSKPPSLENPLMMGFNSLKLDQHLEVLLRHNYTVVRVEEEVNVGKGPKTRKIAEIHSSITDLGSANGSTTNHLVTLYLEIQRAKKIQVKYSPDQQLILAGYSCIDLTTGHNTTAETYSTETEPLMAVQELYRFLVSQTPKEVIIYVANLDASLEDVYREFLYQSLELSRYAMVYIRFNVPSDVSKLDYQAFFLDQTFHQAKTPPPSPPKPKPSIPASRLKTKVPPKVVQRNQASVIEYLDLERYEAGLISYILMLRYVHEHNPLYLKNISKPDLRNGSQRNLALTYNSVVQLHLMPAPGINVKEAKWNHQKKTKQFDSLYSVLNTAQTNLGKRYRRNLLLNPITDQTELEWYYDLTDDLINNSDLRAMLETHLKDFPDIEQLQRKVRIGTIKPDELSLLHRAYYRVAQMFNLLDSMDELTTLLPCKKDQDAFHRSLKEIYETYDLDALEKASWVKGKIETDECFIRPGVDATIDSIVLTYEQRDNQIGQVIDHLNQLIPGRGKLIVFDRLKKNDAPVLEYEDEDLELNNNKPNVPFLWATTAKCTALKKQNYNVQLVGKLAFEKYKGNANIITSDIIKRYCFDLEMSKVSLFDRLTVKYKQTVERLASESNYFSAIVKFIAQLDYSMSNARNAIKYNYYRPKLVAANRSFFQVTDLRHPLIEQLISNEYIPNDLELGLEDGPSSMGIYGNNGSGKTSITRAIGSVIVMAQSGSFVPGHLILSLYHKIMTRLTGGDDLMSGKSSFAVEVLEIRMIQKTADARTLVLADEICRGTETSSALAITTAMIETMITRQTSFIFSTHLHSLVDSKRIEAFREKELRICHLKTTFDPATRQVIYQRKLAEGNGDTIYGILAAESMGLDPDFIALTKVILRENNEADLLSNPKVSRYNDQLYMDECAMCQSKKDLQTHHIQEQHLADPENGFIGTMHKNKKTNLIVLCKTCHHKEVHGANAAPIQFVSEQPATGERKKIIR